MDYEGDNDQPWRLAEDAYLPVDDPGSICKALERVRDNHTLIALVSDDGQVIAETLLVKMDRGLLHMDKPLDWESISSFRVFFMDNEKYWRFFRVEGHKENPFSLSVKIPASMFFLQRRLYKRVVVPPGTRAMVKTAPDTMRTLYVKDISASGMLFCDSVPIEEYPVDGSFQDIMISVPRPKKEDGTVVERMVMPLIEKARVVRSFVDKISCRSCYGISFEYESNHVREQLCRMVKEVELAA